MELIPWLVAVYAVICLGAYFGNRQFMYFPDPTRIAPTEAGLESVEEIEIAGTDGVVLVAWHAPAKEDQPPSFISMATRPTPPIACPKSKRSVRAASVFSTSTTVAMAAPADSPPKRTMSPTRSRPTIT